MVDSTFKRDRRLTHAREFDAVFKTARYRAGSSMFLVLGIENGAGASRVGTVVGKRVAGNSVNRNRIRRQIRESFRLDFGEDGLDIVVVARARAGGSDNAVVRAGLDQLWRELTLQRQRA